jgi:exodeoxyribonuclease V alpha subunit
MQSIESGYRQYIEALAQYAQDPSRVLETLQGFRVLCSVRHGPRGVEQINERIGTWMQRQPGCAWQPSYPAGWYPGRVVLITRNDPSTGLVYGDIGVALPDSNTRLRVYFLRSDQPDDQAGFACSVSNACPSMKLPTP